MRECLPHVVLRLEQASNRPRQQESVGLHLLLHLRAPLRISHCSLIHARFLQEHESTTQAVYQGQQGHRAVNNSGAEEWAAPR